MSLLFRHYHEKKFWSGTFILLSLSVGFMLVLPWLGQLLGGHHPLPFIFLSAISYPGRVKLLRANCCHLHTYIYIYAIVSTVASYGHFVCLYNNDGVLACPDSVLVGCVCCDGSGGVRTVLDQLLGCCHQKQQEVCVRENLIGHARLNYFPIHLPPSLCILFLLVSVFSSS